MDFLTFVSEVGFPIAGAVASGIFIFIILRFILATVTGSVHGLEKHNQKFGTIDCKQ